MKQQDFAIARKDDPNTNPSVRGRLIAIGTDSTKTDRQDELSEPRDTKI